MKKALKLLVIASLLVMSVTMPITSHSAPSGINVLNEDDIVEVEEGFIPYSPAPPQNWTPEQWEQWRLALEMCLIIFLDSARALVADARAILAAAGVIVGTPSEAKALCLPQKTDDVALFASASFTPSMFTTTMLSIDLTPAEIALLTALVNDYEDLNQRIENFLYDFENTEMDFEFAIRRIYELCDELILLNEALEDALASLGDDDPGKSDPGTGGSSGGNQSDPGGSGGGGAGGGNQSSPGGGGGAGGGNQAGPGGSSGGNQAGPPIAKTPERPGGGAGAGGGSPQTPGGAGAGGGGQMLPQTGTAVALTGIASGIALTALGTSVAYFKKKKK